MFQKVSENCAVIFLLFSFFYLPILGPAFLIYLIYIGSYSRYLALTYLAYIYYDWNTKDNGGHNWKFFENSKYSKLLESYFQMSLEADVEIPKNTNYIAGIHPHGVLPLGINSLLNTHDENYKKIFGNGRVAFCMGHYNFELPFLREIVYLFGYINASEKSILNWLSKKDVSHFTFLCVGGSEEALFAAPGVHKIILKKRKGFCRLAIKSGANLIPTYTFGQNSLWDTVKVEPKSWLYKLQMFIHRNFNIGVPVPKGKGRYHYCFVMPNRVPVTTVIGDPVQVKQCDEPTREQINDVNERYCKALIALFDKYKVKYLNDKNAQLIIH